MKTDKLSKTQIKRQIKRDDKIVVIAGKEKGKIGKVLRVYPKGRRVLVSGLNLIKQHVRPTRDLPQGGIIEKEGSIRMSNVMIYCNKCTRGVRVGTKRFPDGTKMRYCKRCELEV